MVGGDSAEAEIIGSDFISDIALLKINRENLAGLEDHNGFTRGLDHAILLELFEYPTSHFTRTTNNTADFLARDGDLHTIRMGHGIRFFAEIQ